ncbi:MAG: hypothetical protein AAGA54_33050 [Myxococcota bacterium]
MRGCLGVATGLALLAACSDPAAGAESDASTGTTAATDAAASSTSTGADSTSTSTSTGAGADSSSSTGDAPRVERPDFVCPNPDEPACASNDGPLRAGVSVRSIVPSCFEAWVDEDDDATFDNGEAFLDCGCDRLCPGDDGYVEPDDGEGDGEFQRAFIAGFQSNRPATGVRGPDQGLVGEGDGLDVRVVVLDQADVRVAIVAVDTVGVFRPDVTRLRSALSKADADVDALIVHALHNHEGPDTMGLWGEGPLVSGYDPAYGEQWRASAIEATLEAIEQLEPVADVRSGSVDAYAGQPGGATNLIRDSRDPWVVDPTVSVLSLRRDDDTPIANLVGYGCHPETLSSRNTLYTSDFVHGLRKTVEEGSQWRRAPGREGDGGVTVMLNGAVGGMMTTLGVSVTNPDGDTFTEPSFDKADSIGQLLGEAALDALASSTSLPEPSLRVMSNTFQLPVENTLYIFGFEAGVIERDVITEDQPPRINTEMVLLELGPLRMLTMPGELLPEIAVGGYDGSGLHSDEVTLVDPKNPNSPDIGAAPEGPYLIERLTAADGPRPWVIGLGNDELGYIIPHYDFELAKSPYLDEAEGDHYEETNSLGPETAALLEAEADRLIDFANR